MKKNEKEKREREVLLRVEFRLTFPNFVSRPSRPAGLPGESSFVAAVIKI